MPQGTVQSVKFHPVVEEGQLGQGDASSGLPGCSRPCSELVSIPEGHGGAVFESHSPLDWVPGSSAGLLLSWSVIHGLFWAYFTCVGFAGQSTTAMFCYKPPYSPSHAPLFLAEARGSGWRVGLPSLVRASGGVGHTQGVVFSLWGFAADVMGTMGVLGATGVSGATLLPGAAGVPSAALALGAAGVSGVTGAADVSDAAGVSGVMGAIDVLDAAGVSGVTGATDVLDATGVSGVTGATDVSDAAGVSGVTGATDVSDAAGVSGVTGATDVSDAAGVSGASCAADIASAPGVGAAMGGGSGPTGTPGRWGRWGSGRVSDLS